MKHHRNVIRLARGVKKLAVKEDKYDTFGSPDCMYVFWNFVLRNMSFEQNAATCQHWQGQITQGHQED